MFVIGHRNFRLFGWPFLCWSPYSVSVLMLYAFALLGFRYVQVVFLEHMT